MPLCRVFRCDPTRPGHVMAFAVFVGVPGKAQRWFSFAAVHWAALTSSDARDRGNPGFTLLGWRRGGAGAGSWRTVGLVEGLRLSKGHLRRLAVAGAELVVDVVLEGVFGAAIGRLAIGSG